MLEQLPLIIVAVVVGLLVGLTGVGGGAIMTPVLIVFFSIQPVVAIATDLVFATLTKLVSTLVHSGQGSVNWMAAREIWRGSIPGAITGILVVLTVGSMFDAVLTTLLVLVLVYTSYSMFRSKGASGRLFDSKSSTSAGGAFIGFAVATTSVGAGALGMALLRAKLGDRNPKQLVGTDIVHAIPVALVAGSTYAFAGFMDIELLLVLLAGSIPGVLVGSLLVGRIDASWLRKFLGAVLLVAAAGILLKTFQ